MPWNGSGVFSRVYSWEADAAAGTDIMADRMDTDTNDIIQGLMHCLTVNGETVPTANLPMANYRHTGASNGVAATDYCTIGQLQNGGGGLGSGFLPLAGGTVTGALTVDGMFQFGINLVSTASGGVFDIYGTPTITGNLTCNGACTVDGAFSIGGNIYSNASGGVFTISGTPTITGSVTVGGELQVDSSFTAAGGVYDGGVRVYSPNNPPTSISGAVTVGALTCTGACQVNGLMTIGAILQTGQPNGVFEIAGAPSVTGLLTASAGLNCAGGTLTIGPTVNCGGSGGAVTINGTPDITGGLTVGGNLHLAGNFYSDAPGGVFDIFGTPTVTGILTVGGLTTGGNISTSAALSVSGTGTFGGTLDGNGVYDGGNRVYSAANPGLMEAAVGAAQPGDFLVIEVGADGVPLLRPAILGPPDAGGQRALLLGA